MVSRIKEVMMRRIWKIPLYLIVALLGTSIVTAAVMYTLTVPSSITIPEPPEGTYEIKLYWESEATTEVESFSFGEVEMGQESTVTFYIKSLSTVDIDVHVSSVSGPVFSYLDPNWQKGIQPDEIREWNLTACVSNLATPGIYNFDLVFDVYPG